jgi:hypothetical protein
MGIVPVDGVGSTRRKLDREHQNFFPGYVHQLFRHHRRDRGVLSAQWDADKAQKAGQQRCHRGLEGAHRPVLLMG